MTKPDFCIYLLSRLRSQGFTQSFIKINHKGAYQMFKRLRQMANSKGERGNISDNGLRKLSKLVGLAFEVEKIYKIKDSKSTTN